MQSLAKPGMPLKTRPPLQLMPSLRNKLEQKHRSKPDFPLPRGIVVEIGIYVCDRVKIALNYTSVCRLFRKEALKNNRFWYFIYSAYK
jgi:hypothetical protein